MTKLIELIVTDEARAGSGESPDSPVRIVTKYFTKTGELVFEDDPCAMKVTPEIQKHMRDWLFSKLGEGESTAKLWSELVYEMGGQPI